MYYGPRTPAAFFAKVVAPTDPIILQYYPQIVDIITRVLETDTGSKLVGFLDPNKEIRFVTNDRLNAFHIPAANSVTFSFDMNLLNCYVPPDDLNSVWVPVDLQEMVVHELIHVSGLLDHKRGYPLEEQTPQTVLNEIQAELPNVPTGTSQSWNVKYANVVKAEMHALDVLNNPPNGIHPISPPRGTYGISACPVTDDKQLWLQQAATVPGWFVFNYNPETVTLLSGDTTGTVKVLYAGNSSPVILSVVADQPIVIPSLNIFKDSLVDLRGVVEALSAQWQSNYQEMIALNEMTSAEDALYKGNVVATSGNLTSLFYSYMNQDGGGSNPYVAAESFIQGIRGWTNGIVGDFSNSSADRALVGTLEQNLLVMYDGLTTTASGLVAGTAYSGMTALVSQLSAFTVNAGQIYQEAQAQSTPNIGSLHDLYQGMVLRFAANELVRLDKLETAAMDETAKYIELFSVGTVIAGQLAGAAGYLGYNQSTIASKIATDILRPTFAESMQNLADNIGAYSAVVGSGAALASWTIGTSAVDSFNGTSANEVVAGHGGDDFLRGFDGNDVIFGGLGNDTLHGGLGADTVYGDDGDDEFWVGGSEGQAGDIMDGGAGDNTLVSWQADLSQTSISNIQTVWINTSVKLTAAQFAAIASFNGDATIIAADAGTYDLSEKDVWFGSLNLLGSGGDDYLAGDGANQTITGGAGNDVLQGNGGADTLLGGDGNDEFLTGFTESPAGEVIDGGAGSNRISSWNADLSAATISNVQTLGAHLAYVTLTAAQLAGFGTLIAYDGAPVTLNAAGAGSYSLAGKVLTGTFNLNGSGGNDTLAGSTGAQVLTGGTGNDTYLQVRGGGADMIGENDATAGNMDILQFGSDVARDQLWFTQSGNDLLVQIIGTADSMTVKDWYLGSARHVEQIRAAGGAQSLLDSKVQNLVSAMAGLAFPTTTTLSQAYHNQLDTVIAANWA